MGGNPISAYGLCHLGDYEATIFSKHSNNRKFGEAYEVLRERQREIETCRAMGMELPWFNPQMELTPIPPDEEKKEAKEE